MIVYRIAGTKAYFWATCFCQSCHNCVKRAHLQVAVLKSAADRWQFIEEETERRRKRAEEEAAKAAAEKAIPKSKRKRVIKPWISLVSSRKTSMLM